MAKKIKRSPIFGAIHAVCSKDEKKVINRVLIRKGKLIATDGYILAVRDIPEDCPNGDLFNVEALIPATVAKKLAKETTLEIENGSMDSVSVKTNEAVYAIPSNGRTPANYPHWEQVIPDPDTLNHFEVSINAEYLKRLSDAITDDGIVTLRFSDNRNGAIHVKGNEGYGVIMPVRP